MYGLRESQALRSLPQSLRDSSLPREPFVASIFFHKPRFIAQKSKNAP